MGYILKTFFGLGVMVAVIAGLSYAVAELLQVGTCASGGPYQVARECPPGTERLIIAFFPGVLVMLAAAYFYAKRGAPPGSDTPGEGGIALLVIWCGLFLGIAFACFWAVWGPDANPGPGGKAGGLIVGFLFVPMGLFPLIALLVSRRRDRDSGPSRVGTSGDAPGSRDKLAQLERLSRLRRDGDLTDAEFERLKQEIV